MGFDLRVEAMSRPVLEQAYLDAVHRAEELGIGTEGRPVELQRVLNLTRVQALIVSSLMSGRCLGKDVLISLTRPAGRLDSYPDERTIQTQICYLRKKLKLIGARVETVWGQGFRMPAHSIAKIETILETGAT